MKFWERLLKPRPGELASAGESGTDERAEPSGWVGLLRQLGVLMVCLVGLVIAHGYADDYYKVRDWLAWRILAYWLCSLVFVASSISVGHLTLKLVAREELPALEHLALAFGVGVMEFQLLVVLGGACQLYYGWFFFVPPVLCLVGVRSLWQFLAATKDRYSQQPLRPLQWVILVFGILCLGLVYFNLLTPDNVSFDSRAMHMGVAEDYVASHGIRRFNEGWVFAGAPHFGSFLYVWAFLIPGSKLHDQMVLAQHLEFMVFLGTTLLAIPAVVRRLVPGADPRVVWVARFLFPGVMLYDSSLSGGADHLAAMYGPLMYLALLLAWKRLEVRYAALLGALVAGAVMTKYTMGIMTLPFLGLALSFRGGSLLVQNIRAEKSERRWGWLWGFLAFGLAGLVVGSPHWLKNWIHYGDPAYPMLRGMFSSRPWLPGSSEMWVRFEETQLWAADHDWSGLKQSFWATLDFSFVPNDWPRFHGQRAVFGSLYTLLFPALLFLRRSLRTWAVVAWVQLGVFCWYWISHQDRYLQSITPLMAVVVAAVLCLIWQQRSTLLKVASGALVAFQVVWGGDVPFLPTHSMIKSPQRATLDLLQAGNAGKYASRFGPKKSSFEAEGKLLPPGARVVMHDQVMTLGIAHASIRDARPWQFGLNYALLKDRAQVHRALKDLGATHVLWLDGEQRYWDSVAGEAVFLGFAKHTINQRKVKGGTLGEMPKEPPNAARNAKLLLVRCASKGYATGIYDLEDVSVLRFAPEEDELPKPRVPLRPDTIADRLGSVEYVVTDANCGSDRVEAVRKLFVRAGRTQAAGKFPAYEYWSKRE
ncbi:MAG: hypothetical protein R3B07_05800 [Polyangiaceae bacterium]